MTLSAAPLWSAEQARDATSGTTQGRWQATGVSIDSRALEPGDLFIALAGPSHDGHAYVSSALAAGAVAAVVEKPSLKEIDFINLGEKLLCVTNTTAALEDLAKAARGRTSAKIIAVTGSVGKTGTKEMLKRVLADQGRTAATHGNLNNHFGLPLCLARMDHRSEFGIFELGMSAAGEILPLSKMTRPHVALITAIEFAHSAFFESMEDIADAKAEIFHGLEPAGIAVLNADNPMFERLKDAAAHAGVKNIRTFGAAVGSDCRLTDVELKPWSSRVSVNLRGKPINFEISVPGRHWVQNALGVLAVVDAVGADPERAASKLAEMPGLKGRGRRHILSIPGGTVSLIDESYNASPASMQAAIEVLGQLSLEAGARKIAVLGDMLELGDHAETQHQNLAGILAKNEIDLVFTTGQFMAYLSAALPAAMRAGHANSAQKISPLLRSVVRPSDVVLVKGSNGSHTGLIVDDLLKLEQAENSELAQPFAVNGE